MGKSDPKEAAFLKVLAHRLRNKMEEKNVSMSELARMTGCTSQHIRTIYHGSNVPSAYSAARISVALGLPLHEWFDGILDMKKPPKRKRKTEPKKVKSKAD